MKRVIFAVLIVFLSSICQAEIPQDIINKLNSEDIDERLDACLFLGRLENPEAVPFLKEKLKDSSMLVRHSAANALSRIGGDEVNGIFKEMIGSASPEKKRIGLAGLAMTGDPSYIESVIGYLSDPDWQVRWSVIYALGEWGYSPALIKLEEISKNDPHVDKSTKEYPIRKMAEDVCKKIKSSIEWHRSFSNAKLLSCELQKPLWIYWMIVDDPLCARMEEGTFFSPEVSDISQNFVCVKIDVQKNAGIVSGYGINAIPSVTFLDKSGNEIDQITGLVSRDELLNKIKNVLENKGTPKDWKEKTEKDPKDIESSWHLAEWNLDNNKIEDAVPLLGNIIRHDPKNRMGYTDNAIFTLGYSFGAISEYKSAVNMLERLRREYPNFKDMDKALYCLGLDYLSLNKSDSAKEIFAELVKVYPESNTIKPAKEILRKL